MPSVCGLSAGPEIEPVLRPVRPRPPQQGAERRPATFEVPAADFASSGTAVTALQVSLDVVSATGIPIASELAGLASGAVYVAHGDMVGAALSVAGLAPIVGIPADTARIGRAARVASSGADGAAMATIPSAGGVIRQFEQPAARTYYRVFSGDATVGKWLTSVPPRSSAFAQEALALPPWNTATLIQEVRVPAGTMMERSRAIPVPEWGRLRGGAEQFMLLEEIPRSSFGPGVPLP
jgi:hypothetical protein